MNVCIVAGARPNFIRRRPDIRHPHHGVGRCLQVNRPGFRPDMLPKLLHVGGVRVFHVIAVLGADLGNQPDHPAVQVLPEQDMVTGPEVFKNGCNRRHAGGKCNRIVSVLQGADRFLEICPGRIRFPGIVKPVRVLSRGQVGE